MRAVVLAGGQGRRLAPYSTVFPKALMPIGEIPILEIVLRQLRHFGVRRVTLAVGHLSELIRAYLENYRSRFEGLDIDFVHETEPTGTAGSLASVRGLDGTFLAMNGDVLTTLDYAALLDHHRRSSAALTIATCPKQVHVDLGVVEPGPTGDVVAYREKPTLSYRVSMGIYVYEPRALRFIVPGRYLDFPDLVGRMLTEGERVSAFLWEGYWLDIGRPEDFEAATKAFGEDPERFNID